MVFHVIVLFIFSEFSADYSWLLCHSMAPDSDELKLQCKLLVVRLKGTRTGSGSEQQLMSLRIPRLEEAGEVLKTTTSRLNLQCSRYQTLSAKSWLLCKTAILAAAVRAVGAPPEGSTRRGQLYPEGAANDDLKLQCNPLSGSQLLPTGWLGGEDKSKIAVGKGVYPQQPPTAEPAVLTCACKVELPHFLALQF